MTQKTDSPALFYPETLFSGHFKTQDQNFDFSECRGFLENLSFITKVNKTKTEQNSGQTNLHKWNTIQNSNGLNF